MVTLAEEQPFAVVASDEYLDMVCSSCFASKVDRAISRCVRCRVVHYCTKECQKKDWVNHKHECTFLRNSAPFVPHWMCRLIARVALKLGRGTEAERPAFNGRIFADLMDHRDEIQKHPERAGFLNVSKTSLCEYMGENFAPDSDLLTLIYGKIQINSFSIGGEKSGFGTGLYIGLSAHDHSCSPDVFVSFDGPKAILRSPNKNLKYSKDLTISYVDMLTTNEYRQNQLRTMYYFDCTCSRCSDPTFDFLCNSIRSTCCPESYCLLDPSAEMLTCNKCGAVSGMTVIEAIAANEKIVDEGTKIRERYSLYSDKSIYLRLLIELFEEFSKILSPLNVNLLMINDRLVGNAFRLDNRRDISKYAPLLLPGYRRYLPVGDADLSARLVQIALGMSYQEDPDDTMIEVIEEALAASLASHGPEHFETKSMQSWLSFYHQLLQNANL